MSNIDNLLVELEAEFGKKKKEKKSVSLKETAKKLSREQFATNADWRLALLMQESNAIAREETFALLWKAEARETWIMKQHCACCLRETEYIAGEYVRFRNKRMHATIKRRTESCTDQFHFNKGIPEEFVHLEQDVSRCVTCINEERMVDEIWEQVQEQIKPLETTEQLIIPGVDI